MPIAQLSLVLITCALLAPVQAHAQKWSESESEHLVIYWTEGVSDEAVEMAKARGDAFYTQIADMLGFETPAKVPVLLEGPAERPDGSWGYPRVDGFGRVHLFRFTPDPSSYFNALAHELVHVFRFSRSHKDWFFEEGFAEFVARRVDDSLSGFPWYDHPVDVVAGQWIESGQDIPLTLLRENHEALNLPCKAQAYALRASFFLWLGEEFGDEKVLEASKHEKAGSDYASVFGVELEQLEARWRVALMERYGARDDAAELALRYRQQSPAKYQPVCEEGEDF